MNISNLIESKKPLSYQRSGSSAVKIIPAPMWNAVAHGRRRHMSKKQRVALNRVGNKNIRKNANGEVRAAE